MKTFSRVVLVAVALLGTAAIAAAQAPAGVLNTLEVQRLVAAETPEASAALAAHFAALADRYAADAAKHKAMGQAYKANANRSAQTSAATHCERLAGLAAESGAAARDLATYHREIAGGKFAVPPKGAAEFHAGHGAPDPTKEQLQQFARAARTRADHLALEEYFVTLARRHSAEADEHVAMARAYRAGVRKGTFDPAQRCDRLAKLAREAEKEAADAALLHRQLADIG